MSASSTPPGSPGDDAEGFRRKALFGLIVAFAIVSMSLIMLVFQQRAGGDFSCFWAAARIARHGLARLYDFTYVTQVQGWPAGPGMIRPFINPPSSLPIFYPFGWLPYWIAYPSWVLLTGALFLYAGRRAGAPWWFILTPWVAFAAYCGQVTFLVGGLALAGLVFGERRILAGVLLGAAAAIKPQLVMLVPVALIAQGRWSTTLAAGLTVAALSGLPVVAGGLQPWRDWTAALGPFRAWSMHQLLKNMINPSSVLTRHGLDGVWAYLLAPPAIAAVWFAFRREASVLDRSLALFGGSLLLSPYAMNYELALLAPAVAARLARIRDPKWPLHVLGAAVYVATPAWVGLYGALCQGLIPLSAHARPQRQSQAPSAPLADPEPA